MNSMPEKLTPSQNLKQCAVCGRSFTLDRIKLHEAICQKSSGIVRKSFDVSRQRIKGTEAEKFFKPEALNKVEGNSPPSYFLLSQKNRNSSLVTNWRWKNEAFIKKIQEAKKCLIEKNKKLSNLPFPPPIELDDTLQCSYCSRKFHKSTAQRHICMCPNMGYKILKSKLSLTKCSKMKLSLASIIQK